MRILICGGKRTENLIKALRNKYKAEISFCYEPLVRNINSVIARGETFDRAVIFEQSLSEDGEITDRAVIGNTLSEALKAITNAYSQYELVFVAESKMMARTIKEETFEVRDISVVVLQLSSQYTVSFLAQLVQNELKDFDRGKVFTLEDVRQMMADESTYNDVVWSDEVEDTTGELMGEDIEGVVNAVDELENFEFSFGKGGITIEEIKQETMEATEQARSETPSDEAEAGRKAKRKGKKTKFLK